MDQREIKFKGWLPHSGKMTHAHTLDELMNWKTNPEDNGTAIWLQFSGRKDIDGIEVYDKDIIENEQGHRAILDYKDFSASFSPRSYFGGGIEWYNQKVKVIGSYLSNPELITNP
jgi:hypothetical protein